MKKTGKNDIIVEPRKGLVDIWNAHMVEGATFSTNDIPLCPTTAATVPESMITWDEAKHVCKIALARGEKNFRHNAFVCFYLDDYKFDGPKGIWNNEKAVLDVLRHFAGVITPDFSTYQDFPEPIKEYNTYRMRACGYWYVRNGLAVINNVRWGTPETWRYCWDGIQTNSIVCIGTVGGNPKKLIDRRRFEEGLDEMIRVLSPHTVLVYGSANYPCFEKLKNQGIKVISYPGRTASAFERRRAK